MAQKALATVKNFLSKLPVKAPWKSTGVASSPEFLSHLPVATEYRVHSPGSQPVRPAVPQAETKLVYDIKYYTRDTRRAGQLVGGTNKLHMVTRQYDVTAKDPALEGSELPPTLGKPYKWGKRTHLLDFENNGYT
ncbi:hypothetical protein WJX72_002645 [[Myrmecia] bisecta]|uniref:NADH dehydrogenase [ubiquinone] 1 alpha subcomplex subunit 7 n=1 Tax=[Myrmecia] bisecta TaxID=41462 RepID=A0AAW1QEH6_9CHLO